MKGIFFMNEKKHFLQKTWVVALLALLCCVLWGSATPSIKKGYEIFGILEDCPENHCRYYLKKRLK